MLTEYQSFDRGVDRNGVYQSAHAVYFRETRTIFLRSVRKSGEFKVNLTTEKLARATDYCGVRSGRDVDKWKETHLTSGKASKLQYAPIVEESPVNLECKVTEVKELGSHHMFLASVEAVQVSEELMGKNGKFELNHAGLLVYSHGEYLNLGRTIGTFGYSVKKKKPGKKKTKK